MSKHCEMILVRADPTDCHRIDERRSSGAWAGVARPRHPLSSFAQNHLRAQARQLGLGSAGCVSRRLGTASPFPATPSPSPVAWCPFPIPRSAQELYSRYAGRPASPRLPSTPPSRWRQGGYGRVATIVGLFFALGLVAALFLPGTRGKQLPESTHEPTRHKQRLVN